MSKKKIGVFLCWCGSNIAEVIQVDTVLDALRKYPHVEHAEYYKYFCSQPGQTIIEETIKKKSLDGVVIAACSPMMHESTFRKAAERAGLNYYQCEIANVREQCSWVHRMDKDNATKKAISIIESMVEKLKGNQSLIPDKIQVTKRALVIGAGISGIQAAIDIADAGHEVIVVERLPSIGGHMAQLGETFPTLDCSQCIMTPKMVEIVQHPNIKLLTFAEIESVSGFIGNFKVKVRKKAAYVDRITCTACGKCIEKCPVQVSSEFNFGIDKRKAIYVLSPQAVPNTPVIDKANCLYLQSKKCGICRKVCEIGAVDYEQKEEIEEFTVGCIVAATGFDLYPTSHFGEYGAGSIPDVITGFEFERLNAASGPTQGVIKRPSDGKIPQEVVFITCCGSRDPENHKPYCSKICCMYLAKQAILYKRKVPDGHAYNCYMDIRAGGKGYEEFIVRGMEEEGVTYIRGRVSRLYQEKDKIIVKGADTLLGKNIEIKADMVVLANAIVPAEGSVELAKKINLTLDENGFYKEGHVKLRPVESNTRGIFICGMGQGPKDIPDSVAQASAAASKAIAILSKKVLSGDPGVASVIEEICKGCGICVTACPYDAREIDKQKGIAVVNKVLCQGCGACITACPNKACQLNNMSMNQVLNMIDKLV